MIVVRVELHSANSGLITEIARMEIVNDGLGTSKRGNYQVTTLRGRDKDRLDMRVIGRCGFIVNFPKQTRHVWELVMKALNAVGYRVWRADDDPIFREDQEMEKRP